MSNIIPLYDRLIIEPIETEEKTSGGILIPDTAKEKPTKGRVVACGAGYRGDDGTIHPMHVKMGDVVIFNKWSGTEVDLGGKKCLVVKESDVLAAIK